MIGTCPLCKNFHDLGQPCQSTQSRRVAHSAFNNAKQSNPSTINTASAWRAKERYERNK